MEEAKPETKKIMVSHHGREWPIYPCKLRNSLVYKVLCRINGERKFKTFASLPKASHIQRLMLINDFQNAILASNQAAKSSD